MEIKTFVVVLAYFQNVNLTERDTEYLNSLRPENGKMAAILDVKRGACTAEQPLRPNQRQDILRGHTDIFDAGVLEHLHISDNERWSLILDKTISDAIPKGTTHLIVYAAKSLAEKYVGQHNIILMDDIPGLTDVTEPVTVKPNTTDDFRQGVMFAQQRAFPVVYSTVDIVLVDESLKYVLLGRKKDEKKWRFPGGFVDPTDVSKESAWLRELGEEVPSGVVSLSSDIQYIHSTVIPDCRYPGRDKIMTTIFGAVANFDITTLQAGDDLVEVQLFLVNDELSDIVTKDHQCVLKYCLDWLEKTRTNSGYIYGYGKN